MSKVISGRPVLKEVIDKFKTKQKKLEEAANEILRMRKDRERKRLGLTLEEYEAMLMDGSLTNFKYFSS
jgi:hypothetical protein